VSANARWLLMAWPLWTHALAWPLLRSTPCVASVHLRLRPC